jgi:dipeptidase E
MQELQNKRGEIFIGGGGSAEDSYLLDKAFVASLTKKNILYLPIAIYGDSLSYEAAYDWFIETMSSVGQDFINITMWTDLINKKYEDLNNFDSIYIGGGNTFNLIKQIRDNNFDVIIKRFHQEGGVLYGGSAGAIIYGSSLQPALNSDKNKERISDFSGLDLLMGSCIWPHYAKEQDNQIFTLVKKLKRTVIALSEKSGIQYCDNKLINYGIEPGYLFTEDEKIICNNLI